MSGVAQVDLFGDALVAEFAVSEGLPSRWPGMLAALIDLSEQALRPVISDDVRRLEAAQRVIVSISHFAGGRQFYLPRGDSLRLAMRDRELYALSGRGWAVAALATRYDLSERQVYAVIEKQQALDIGARQGDLFPGLKENQNG